ncbi:iron ABC transporter permease [Paenibacillus zeisoli]|uniref:Iron ABC transporter permease n=1 Tax=Paenibacillus zeisoli TaxID=2496267 RepID=A0A433XNH2_9BACL|nr:iron ABC transporter permease [Paenibacillus zeisoli]RUT35625.1 iron ABC transporter permease [Paenibacillus zeisoli]
MITPGKHSIPFAYKMVGGIVFFVLMFILAMILGAADATIHDIWLALTSSRTSNAISIIRDIRLPREVAGIFVGSALAVSGAIMQGMTRNPLADPSLLGLTSGANAALAFTIAFIPAAGYFGIMTACFVGAGLGALMIFGISSLRSGGFSPLRIVLAGSAVSAFLYAVAEGVSLYFKISKDVSMWTAGGLIGTTWEQIQVIVPFIVVGTLISIALSKQLTVLSLNEEVATSLGQRTRLLKSVLLIVIVMLAGASVALVGNLAFIGLMIPHVARAIAGTDYRYIIPMSAVLGASFMLLADTLGRILNPPYETPVAAIVAMLGLPFFLVIVRKGGKVFK